jgi:DNA-binding XRE family transcriptional regulator
MTERRNAKRTWTPADRARHKAIREEFAHCPSQEELQASGNYEEPVKGGAYFAVKTVIHELKKSRLAAGLTLEAVAKHTGMDQATLSRLENGRQPNPTVDTLWRYARAVGRQLVLTHADPALTERKKGKAAPSASKKSPRPARAG